MNRAIIVVATCFSSSIAQTVTVCQRTNDEMECDKHMDFCYWDAFGKFCADNVYDIVCSGVVPQSGYCLEPWLFINVRDPDQTFTSDDLDPTTRPAVAIRTLNCHNDDPSSDRMRLQQSIDVGGITWLFQACTSHGATVFIHQGLINSSKIKYGKYVECMDSLPVNQACNGNGPASVGFESSSAGGEYGASAWISLPWGVQSPDPILPTWTEAQNFDTFGYASWNYLGFYDASCAQRTMLEMAGAPGAVWGSTAFPDNPQLVESLTTFVHGNDCLCEWNGTACVPKTSNSNTLVKSAGIVIP